MSSTVHNKYGTEVWKGITGPEDSEHFDDYWLWVERLRPALEEGNNCRLQNSGVHCFKGSGEFSCGISMYTMIKELSDSE